MFFIPKIKSNSKIAIVDLDCDYEKKYICNQFLKLLFQFLIYFINSFIILLFVINGIISSYNSFSFSIFAMMFLIIVDSLIFIRDVIKLLRYKKFLKEDLGV